MNIELVNIRSYNMEIIKHSRITSICIEDLRSIYYKIYVNPIYNKLRSKLSFLYDTRCRRIHNKLGKNIICKYNTMIIVNINNKKYLRTWIIP